MSNKTALPRGLVAVRADASGDPKVIFAELQKSFETFQAEQKEQVKELKAGLADAVTTEKIDKISAEVLDLQASLDEAVKKVAAIEIGGPGQEGGPVDKEYTDAFLAHFKKGEIQANLNKGTDSEGGYVAPVEWDRTITDKLIEVSPMRSIARVQPSGVSAFKKLYNLRGTASGWVGETAARPETNTATFGEMTWANGELYANPAATQQMLDDAQVNLDSWLADEVETEFAYQEGLAFVSGDGTNKPAGFLSFVTGAANAATNPLGSIEAVTAAANTGIAYGDIISLIYALPSAFTMNARFTMNRTTMGSVMGVVDGDGRGLWQPSLIAGQPSTLAGYPVTELAAMPGIGASAISLAFGDFQRGYLIVDRMGVRVLRDPFTNKPFVHFYTTKRVGGAVNNPETLKVLQHPA